MREIDPKIFGPGTWIVTHVLGLVSDDSHDCTFYCSYVFRMIHALPCGKCRRHAIRYLEKYPVPTTREKGSLFEWSVNFHNEVNRRLKKPVMTLDEARDLYQNTEVVLSNSETKTSCSINPQDSCQDASL